MADTQHGFGRIVWVSREEVTTTDLNNVGKMASRNIQQLVRALFSDGARGTLDGILDGFVVSPGGGLSVDVGAGLGFLVNILPTPSAYESDLRVIASAGTVNLAIGANGSGNPRIDIVEVQDDAGDFDITNRNVLTPGGLVQGSTDPHRFEPTVVGTVSLKVKQGTPAGSPVPPTVDAGFVKVAEVLVANGAVVINAADIADTRKMLEGNPRVQGAPFSKGYFERTGAGTAQGDFTITESVNADPATVTKRIAAGAYGVSFRHNAPPAPNGTTAPTYAVLLTAMDGSLGLFFVPSIIGRAVNGFSFRTLDFAGVQQEINQGQGIAFEAFLLNPRA